MKLGCYYYQHSTTDEWFVSGLLRKINLQHGFDRMIGRRLTLPESSCCNCLGTSMSSRVEGTAARGKTAFDIFYSSTSHISCTSTAHIVVCIIVYKREKWTSSGSHIHATATFALSASRASCGSRLRPQYLKCVPREKTIIDPAV
jgi:hypothetical protein